MESSELRRLAIGALKTHEGDIWPGVTVKMYMGAVLANYEAL